MDGPPPYRGPERPFNTSPYPSGAAQAPHQQIPHSDPFHPNRDPFPSTSQHRRGSFEAGARAWRATSGNNTPPPSQHNQPLPPPPSSNGMTPMSLPYDASRRRSIGEQHSDQHPHLPPFQSRQMPPPSPPQAPSASSSLLASAPRGPPTASPFAGARDLASYSSHRPATGMSISSILGGSEERKPHTSPHATSAGIATPKTMPPPSPGRARSTSMREGSGRGFRDVSPPRSIYGEPRPMSAALGYDRAMSETRREGNFGSSPQFQHGFRAFQPPHQPESRPGPNGHAMPGRPNSQPPEQAPPRSVEDIIRRDAPPEGRFATFPHFAEPHAPTGRHEPPARFDPYTNTHGPTSQPTERGVFSSPQMDRERGQPAPMRFQPGTFGTPMREEQAGLFRPAYYGGAEPRRESAEARQFHEPRREPPRSTPPAADFGMYDRGRNGFIDRPMTLEEHQRMEAQHRDHHQGKENDGAGHRALLNISPDLNRKGRNSPLPQAVQGAQPRHVGPGGDNPGIKMEFGRMFSGLGSGAGTATPSAGQPVNGTSTPSRLSPSRHVDGGDLVRTAVAEIEEGRGGGKAGGASGRKKPRDESGKMNGTGRDTPDQQRGAKRAKTNHTHHHHHHHVHPHHHHHHQHEPIDNGPSPFNMLRFPSNPLSHSNAAPTPSHHHHHHHHAAHAHPGHHHHHVPRSMPSARKPTVSIMSRRLVEDCAQKPRKHLGTQPYTTELSMPPAADTPLDAKVKFSSKMKPIPYFEDKENCTYTVRVPRVYLGEDPKYLQEICKRRQIWGTDVYTDDSDVVAAAVHAGWLQGDFGEYNADLRDVLPNNSDEEEEAAAAADQQPTGETTLAIRPRKPVRVPRGCDAHITLLILPPLERYVSTHQHHLWSREWAARTPHDGMSFMIHRVEFVDAGTAAKRGAVARKARIAVEEAKRREAAASLLSFASGGGDVRVGA